MEGEGENKKKEMTTLDAINVRTSIRSYSQYPNDEQQAKIKNFVENPIAKTPFAEKSTDVVRLCYIPDPLGFKSSLGVIGGNKHWICGAVKKDDKFSYENYGFILEWLILECTKLDLGTVWLGGTFTIAPFNEHLKLTENESLIAVTPVGVSSGGSFIGKMFSFVSGSRKRKEWDNLFFDGKFAQPLAKDACDEKYQKALEAVRLGPSAMNKQPWIIVREKREGTPTFWHFFRRDYSQFSRIDIGIGMCHWQLACEELSLEGKWEDKLAEIKFEIPKNIIYVKSWISSN